MWLNRVFGKSPEKKIGKQLKETGSLIGSREHKGRKIFIYLLEDFFVQVMFKQDDPIEEIEHLLTFADLNQLNSHLEKEFKSAF